MKRGIRIKTVSQWYLLKQLNGYLGKKKVPEEVMRKIYRILHFRKLGKSSFLVLCLNRIKDDYQGIEDAVGMYPNKIWIEEDVEEILTRGRKGKLRSWYITYIKIGSQKIPLIYTTEDQSNHWRDEE